MKIVIFILGCLTTLAQEDIPNLQHLGVLSERTCLVLTNKRFDVTLHTISYRSEGGQELNYNSTNRIILLKHLSGIAEGRTPVGVTTYYSDGAVSKMRIFSVDVVKNAEPEKTEVELIQNLNEASESIGETLEAVLAERKEKLRQSIVPPPTPEKDKVLRRTMVGEEAYKNSQKSFYEIDWRTRTIKELKQP